MDDFLPASGIDWEGGGLVGTVKYGTDQQVVLFFNKSVHDPLKSKELGRPFNVNKVYVRMHPPGERLNIIERPAQSGDAARFPVQWAQFKQNQDQTSSGTPIELLPEAVAAPAIAANLRACGVQTIEQLANLSGSAIDGIGMGAQQWCNNAKQYLEASQKGVHYTHMQHELEQRDGQIRVLQRQVDELKSALDKVAPQGGVNQMAAPTLTQAQIAQLLSGMLQNPQFPPPGVAPTKAFDAQTAQIAATHPAGETKPANSGVFQALPQPPVHPEVVRKRGRPRKVQS